MKIHWVNVTVLFSYLVIWLCGYLESHSIGVRHHSISVTEIF